MDFLRISENKRYFVRGGAPFFWMGDTIWPAVSRYSLDEIKIYFAKRREQGFTVSHVMLPWTAFDGTAEGRNAAPEGVILPWLNNNPASPNEEYFIKLDNVIKIAAENEILLTILPNGGGSGTQVDHEKIITVENVRAYGNFLGRRYKNEPNIVWVNGFDLLPWMYEDITREFAAGVSEADKNHLMFFHPCGGASSSHFHGEDWLCANFIQTWSDYNSIRAMVTADYHRKPVKPVVHVEGAYEAGTEYPSAPITSWHARLQAYWSYFSGGFHTYGHNDMWRKTPHWKNALDSKGARQMKILKDFFTSIEWWDLIPDDRMISPIYKSGHAAMRSANGKTAAFYFSHRSAVNADLNILGEDKFIGEWTDPASGEKFCGGEFAGRRRIDSPAVFDDALLLLRAL